MADLLNRAATLLASIRKTTHAVDVEIRRGGDSVTGVKAAIGTTQDLDLDQAGNIRVGVELRDFKIAAADYDFGRGPVEPERDDLIIDSSSGQPITYAVRPRLGDDSARWADRYGVSWRVHTQRVDSP